MGMINGGDSNGVAWFDTFLWRDLSYISYLGYVFCVSYLKAIFFFLIPNYTKIPSLRESIDHGPRPLLVQCFYFLGAPILKFLSLVVIIFFS